MDSKLIKRLKQWSDIKYGNIDFFERTKANSYRHPLFKCIRNYE